MSLSRPPGTTAAMPASRAPRASSTRARACGAASPITKVTVAVEFGGDVDIDDVAGRQPDMRARHAVAHDVVATDADRGGEAVVAELRWPAALRLGMRAHIDFCRRHPGRQPRADVRQPALAVAPQLQARGGDHDHAVYAAGDGGVMLRRTAESGWVREPTPTTRVLVTPDRSRRTA